MDSASKLTQFLLKYKVFGSLKVLSLNLVIFPLSRGLPKPLLTCRIPPRVSPSRQAAELMILVVPSLAPWNSVASQDHPHRLNQTVDSSFKKALRLPPAQRCSHWLLGTVGASRESEAARPRWPPRVQRLRGSRPRGPPPAAADAFSQIRLITPCF